MRESEMGCDFNRSMSKKKTPLLRGLQCVYIINTKASICQIFLVDKSSIFYAKFKVEQVALVHSIVPGQQ